MTLPVDIDSTYADTGGADVALHQQHHDLLHGRYNLGHPAGAPTIPYQGLSATWNSRLVVPGWRFTGNPHTAATTAAFESGILSWFPIFIAPSQNFDALVCEITTAAAGGNSVRLCLYDDAGTDRPTGATTLLEDHVVASTSTGQKVAAFASTRTLSGWKWLAKNATVNTAARAMTATSMIPPISLAQGTTSDGSVQVGLARSQSASSAQPSNPTPQYQVYQNTGGAVSVWLRTAA